MMSVPRLTKIFRDLTADKLRTLLIVLTISVGIVGAGTVLTAQIVLTRELARSYQDTNPSSITLWTPDALKAQSLLRHLPIIEDTELRHVVRSRIEVRRHEWRTLVLFVVEDLAAPRINRFRLERGRFPTQENEILLERDALGVAGTDLGSTLFPRLPRQNVRPMRVTGIVHAPGLPPAKMENLVYGFISRRSLAYLGAPEGFTQVLVNVADNTASETTLTATAEHLAELCRAHGLRVTQWKTSKPGVHPHDTQLRSFLFLLQVFGVLALILSGLLVINMTNTMLAGQLRQIGIMKAIGGRSLQIAGLYFTVVLALGVLALSVAMPVAYHLSLFFVDFAAAELNFNISSYTVPGWVFLLQIAIGLLVPVLAASYPIAKGSLVTVHRALTDVGTGTTRFGSSLVDHLLEKLQGVPRSALLSFRNVFRKKGRLLLTLVTLSAGGAVFILALNVNASLKHTLDSALGELAYDIRVDLDSTADSRTVLPAVERIRGVSHAEVWSIADVEIRGVGEGEHFFVPMKGLPGNARAFGSPLMAGRRLQPDERGRIVINHKLARKLSMARVGDFIELRLNDRWRRFEIAGLVKAVDTGMEAYLSDAELRSAVPDNRCASEAYIKVAATSEKERAATFARIEETLAEQGNGIRGGLNVRVFRSAFLAHLRISVVLLLAMAVLIVIIGGVGLMSTMSVNVMERTREIGIMRACGATRPAILMIHVGESVVIGVLSWLIAALLAIPLTLWVGQTFGMIFIQTTLNIQFAAKGVVLWLMLAVLVAILAAAYPASKASNRSVREALSYE